MRRTREYDNTRMSFTLAKAGCKAGPTVELTGAELADLSARLRGRKSKTPPTKGQMETAALFVDFVSQGRR